jgi:hypothetical protein
MAWSTVILLPWLQCRRKNTHCGYERTQALQMGRYPICQHASETDLCPATVGHWRSAWALCGEPAQVSNSTSGSRLR